jgi:hypothetical protein
VSDLADAIEREAVPGQTTVGELGALIDAPSWLSEADVERIDVVGGTIPISWAPDGTVAVIALPSGSEFVYFSVEEDLSAAELAAGLRGEAGSEATGAAVLRQVAVHRAS